MKLNIDDLELLQLLRFHQNQKDGLERFFILYDVFIYFIVFMTDDMMI